MTSPFFDRRLPALLAEAVELYRGGGRRHAGLSDKELAKEFRAAFRAYAVDQSKPAASRRLNEVAAEYVLRHQAAPLKPVMDEVAAICCLHGYEEKLPLVLLAFGRVMCIPGLGAVLFLRHEDDDMSSDAYRERADAERADFLWMLGLPPERAA